MSTKIYTGFKFKSKDIFEVHETIKDITVEIREKGNELASKFFAEYMTNIYDRDKAVSYADKLKKGQTVYQVVASHYFEKVRHMEKTGERAPDVDFGMDVCLYFHEGEIFGTLAVEREELLSIWMEHPEIEEYRYWNNSDKPEEISDEKWESRKKVWEEIFKDSGVPAFIGYGIRLVKLPVVPHIGDIMPYIPSFEERVDSLSQDALFRDRTQGTEVTNTNMMTVFGDFKDWMKTPEGRLLKAKKDGFFETAIKKELAQEDLM